MCFPKQIEGSECCRRYFPPNDSIELRFYELPEYSGLKRFRHASRALLSIIDQVEPNYVLIPTADGVAAVLAFESLLGRHKKLRSIPVDILLMRGEHLHRGTQSRRRIRKWLEWKITMAGPWNRILHLDPLIWSKHQQQLELCPDPVPQPDSYDRSQAREFLGLPQDRRLIVSVGDQNESKGLDWLLHAFAENCIPDDCCLVVAGPMSAGIRQLAASVASRKSRLDSIIIRDCFLSEKEFQAAIIAADLVAVPYKATSQPSGVACRAISWGRPMIGTNSGWIKWACEVLGAGYLANTSDPVEFATEIVAALTRAKTFERSNASTEFSRFNSVENYCRVWRRGVLAKAGHHEESLIIPTSLTNCFEMDGA